MISSPLVQTILLIGSLIFLIGRFQKMTREMHRLSSNQETLTRTQEQIQLNNGRMAYQNGLLQVKLSELKQQFPRISQQIQELDLRPRQVREFSQTAMSTETRIQAARHDTVVLRQGDSLRYQVFRYTDNYYSIFGISSADSQQLQISYRDTLTQVVYRKRKYPWLWILSPSQLEQRISLGNPDARVEYNQTIKIGKR